MRRPRSSARLVAGLALSAALVAGVTAAGPAGAAASDDGAGRPTVTTADGAVRGVRSAGTDAFLGLPFAAPPVKALRLAPPRPPAAWTGVRDASRQGPACLQFQPTGVREEQATSEDCLYLDVYRPATTSTAPRPVMLWVHGGGWTQGSGVIYAGRSLAATADVVVVSVNYRLGALGYLALPETRAAGGGNLGTLDQVAALRWVRDNAAAFGGDPGNVTVFGQSAGAGAGCNLLAAPDARGLFDKVVLQSLGCASASTSRADAERTSLRFARAAGCTDPATRLDCLRTAWAPALVAAAQDVVVNRPAHGTGVLPLSSVGAIGAGRWNRVPVLLGNTAEEGKLFVIDRAGLTAAQYRESVRSQYGDRAGAVLARYPASAYPKPFYALAAQTTDSFIACGVEDTARLLAPRTPTYRYEFDDPTSPTLYGFQPPGIDMSNAHSAELAYLFDFTLGDRPLTATQERLATRMQRYWGAFAHNGSPTANGVWWPRWTPTATRTVALTPQGEQVVDDVAAEHRCSFWGSLG